TFNSYITARPGEVLTQSFTGCSYSSGYWSVAVGNFPTAWSAGEVLRTEVSNMTNGETNSVDVIMTSAGSDAAPDLNLDPVVPVELSSFNVHLEPGQVRLEWTTETETNNFGFEILRKKNNSHFEKIGFVPGHGTSSLHHYYRYVDNKLSGGTYYYQLKQIDTDGSFELSETKTVLFDKSMEYQLEKNYPNPFNPETTINYQIGVDQKGLVEVKLLIYNSQGELVRTLVNEAQPEGFHVVKWDGHDNFGNEVTAGLYFGKLTTKNYVSTLKMIYMK
ncbi:MAG TPA: FlgD immunoglobulin-like domain containing protein, partial [bacterium]